MSMTKSGKARAKRRVKSFFSYLYMILLSIIILYPILITVSSAFKSKGIMSFKLDFSSGWSLDNFTSLFHETYYLDWYKNTLIIATVVMIVQVAVVTLAGYAFSRYNFIGKKNSLILFLIIQMVPTMSALTAYYVLATLLGGLDHYWFLALIYIGGGIPMNTWLMKGYFDTVPTSLDESARMDGAGHLRVFGQIVLPLVKPMIAVQALWAFMGPFGDYLMAKFLLRDQQSYTLAVGLQTLISNPREQKVGMFAAGAVLSALPIVILFLFLQRNFVSGLTKGGTKG